MPHYLHSILNADILHPILYHTVLILNLENGLEILNASLFYLLLIYLTPYLTPQCGFRIWKRVLKLQCLILPSILHAHIPHIISESVHGFRIWKGSYLPSILNADIPRYPTVWIQDLDSGFGKGLQCLIIYIQYCMPIYLIPHLYHSVDSRFGKGF